MHGMTIFSSKGIVYILSEIVELLQESNKDICVKIIDEEMSSVIVTITYEGYERLCKHFGIGEIAIIPTKVEV